MELIDWIQSFRYFVMVCLLWGERSFGHSVPYATGQKLGNHPKVSNEQTEIEKQSSTANSPVDIPAESTEGVSSQDGLPVMGYTVTVTNDGPVILGSSATFIATVTSNSSTLQKMKPTYQFKWTGPPEYLPQYMYTDNSCTIEIPFKMSLDPGEMSINVTVNEMGPFGIVGKLIGQGTSSILVTDTINGQILLSSLTYPECNMSNPSCTIPSRTNLSLTAALHDPGDFFEDAFLLYKWVFGNGDTRESLSPDITYVYPSRGQYNISLLTTALKQGDMRTGVWWRVIRVLDAITNLTISSASSSVQVGNTETVNVTCNGSPPVEVCLTIDDPSAEWSNQTNTTCEMVLDKCHITLVYHFKSSGEYRFAAAATNNVSFAVSVSSIHAHSPALPPESITAITVAVIAGLCMTCFAVISFIHQVRKNRERHVEVANFDFDRERTDSFVRLKTRIFSWKRVNAEKKPLMNNSASNFYSL